MEDDCVATFKPVFNIAKGALHCSSPHSRNAALLPFLIHVYPCESTTLLILTSDFHANTWHATLTFQQLNELKEKLAFNGTLVCFLQSFHEALCSNQVIIELGGPASAMGGKGATSAILKTCLNAHTTQKDMSVGLDNLKSRIAIDASAALALDLYNAYSVAQNRIAELESSVESEKQKNTNALNTIIEGKASSIHFRQNSLQNVVQTEEQPSWSGATSPGMLLSAQSPIPSINLGSYHSPSIPSNLHNECSSAFNMDVSQKGYKSSESLNTGVKRVCQTSALKLCDQNSYSRSVKKQGKGLVQLNTHCSKASATTDMYGLNHCDEGVLASYPVVQKGKCGELDSDLIMKIESGAENRSAKTDAWARRHYMEWRRNLGLLEGEIEEIPAQEFAESLIKFFCMVKKRNGDLFPPESLKAMHRAFSRILQAQYKKVHMEDSFGRVIVDAAKTAIFEKTRMACVEAMKHSLLHGANGSKKRKIEILMADISHDILLSDEYQITTPRGLCRRLCFYAIHKFGINSHMELYDTTDIEFERMVNEQGAAFWNYNERKAEKYKRKEIFRAIIQCDDKDVVECLDKYFMRLPPKPLEDEPRRLFLAPIKRPTTLVWFRHQNISARTLREWYKFMKPKALKQGHAIKNTLNNSSCSLRCKVDCEKGMAVVDDTNMPRIDGIDKAAQDEPSRNSAEVESGNNEDVGKEDDEDLTDVD